MIALIAAVSSNGVIGLDGKIPWHLPEDLARFKSLTTGEILVMGRRTYESIGRPLPRRMTIVVSSQPVVPVGAPGDETLVMGASSLTEALHLASFSPRHVFLAGGSRIYEDGHALGVVDRIYLTEVHLTVKGDTFFRPKLDGYHERSRLDVGPCAFVVYDRSTLPVGSHPSAP